MDKAYKPGFIDNKPVKARLQQYSDREREIDILEERLERYETRLYSLSSPKYSDMPKSNSPVKDKMTDLIVKRDEILSKIENLQSVQAEELNWIEETIKPIKKPEERAVIQIRYIDGAKWTDVSRQLFGKNENFEENADSYLRRTTKLHGQALNDMARVEAGIYFQTDVEDEEDDV